MRPVLICLSVLLLGMLRPTSAAPVAARMADDFVESAGICTHLEYTDKAYYSQWTTVRQRLIVLGIRHIRAGLANAGFVYKIRDLANDGIRTIWVLDPDLKSWSAAGSLRLSGPTREAGTLTLPGFYRARTQ